MVAVDESISLHLNNLMNYSMPIRMYVCMIFVLCEGSPGAGGLPALFFVPTGR